jgi:solute carrier family 34 (sodium-dependent phosphate cotransporter)
MDVRVLCHHSLLTLHGGDVQENQTYTPDVAQAQVAPQAEVILPLWRRLHWYKLPLFLVSLFLFILAITLMKDGARDLGPLVRDRLAVTNFADALGFGWLFAYVIMSGSPVAGVALTFLDAGAVDQLGAYAMVVGSRMGASFIVLFIGFLYIMRGRNRSTSLGMGLVSLSVAASMQVLALFIGIPLLRSGVLDRFQLSTGAALSGLMDAVLDPISQSVQAVLPGWGVFLVGLGIIMVSFSLFDRCLPEMTLKEQGIGTISQFVYKPWVMFLLGSGVTFISMSVSISLSILVPLSQRGFVRRENVIPYIMGANISTFIDTLLAAVLLGNPAAFTVVLTEMLSLAIVAAVVLLVNYRLYERTLLRFVDWTVRDNRNLSAFMLTIFVVPILLMLF